MSSSKVVQKDTITPHRLAIAILIREFWTTRETAKSNFPLKANMKVHVRNFCLMILKVIQSPDLEFKELLEFLQYGQYQIDATLYTQFESTLKTIPTYSLEFFLDIIKAVSTLTQAEDNVSSSFTIAPHSIIGCYLRRLVLSFDKLNFAEVVAFFESFKTYVNFKENANISSLKAEWCKKNKSSWSQRQAELFIVTQAALITNNEEKAMPPKILHKEIQNLLKSSPQLSEAHYLSYLNYLRVKEFCGAIDSLYHSFDKKVYDSKTTAEDRTKVYRFGALNLAVLHYQFGHREEALMALKEAIRMAQEASDDICLQHALSWLYCLTHNRRFIEHSIIKSLDLSLSYIMSLGIQSFVQFAGLRGGDPKKIFDTVTRSDVINCQHTHHDLISTSYSQKSSLWMFYGKIHMSALWSQLLLNLNTENLPITKTFMGEGYCQALCNLGSYLMLEGEYDYANAILKFAKEKFPNEPISHNWMLCQYYLEYTFHMHQKKFIEAEMAAQKIAVFDQYESSLCLADLLIQQKNYDTAKKCLQVILSKSELQDSDVRIDYDIRARILYTQLQVASNYPSSTPNGVLTSLNAALAYTNDYHLHYLNAVIQLYISHIQLLMGMPHHALKLLNTVLPQILANGFAFDRARALLLYAKCLVASAQQEPPESRRKVVEDCVKILEKVKSNFNQVKAFHRVKDVLYLQARLYDEIDCESKRNLCAMEYRIMDEEYPSKNKYSLLIDL